MPDFMSEGGGLVQAYKVGADLARESADSAFERKLRQEEFGLHSQQEQLAEQRFRQEQARDVLTAAEAESKDAAAALSQWSLKYGAIPKEQRTREQAEYGLMLSDRGAQADAMRLHAYRVLYGDDLARNHSDASTLFEDMHSGRVSFSDIEPDQLANAVTIATRRLPSSFIDTPNSTSEVGSQIKAVQAGMQAQQQGKGTQQLLASFTDLSKHEFQHLNGQTAYDGSTIADAQLAALTPVPNDPSRVVPVTQLTVRRADGAFGTQYRPMMSDSGHFLSHPDSTADAPVKTVTVNGLFDHFGSLTNFHGVLNSPGYREKIIQNYLDGGEDLNQQTLNHLIVLGTNPTNYQADVELFHDGPNITAVNKKTGQVVNQINRPLTPMEQAELKQKEAQTSAEQEQAAFTREQREMVHEGRGRYGVGGGLLGAAPDDVESTAKAIANYDMAPPTGRTAYTPQGQAIMARVRQINSSYNAADYQASAHAVDRFDSGKQGDTVRSFNVLVGHLKTLGDAADALHNGNVPLFNRLSNLIAQETGQEAPKDFNAVRGVVADEIIKAVTGSAGALGDREDVQKQLDRASSPQQMRGVISQFTELAGSQLKGLRKQYEASSKRKDFNDKYLYPETLQALGEGTGDAGANTTGGAPAQLPKGWSIQKEK